MTRPDQATDRPDAPEQWHRLSPWMIAVKPIEQLPQLIPLLIAIVFAGRGAPDLAIIIGIVVVALVSVVPWLVTRYQVTDEHVRVRSGVLTRKVATARRDRIRSVDLTASPAHRIVGLTKVRIGTGGDKESSVVELNAIPTAEANVLHGNLMATAARITARDAEPEGAPVETTPPQELARLQRSWLRYSPFSLTGFAAAAAIGGLAAQVANEADLYERSASVVSDVGDRLQGVPVAALVVATVVAVLAIGAVLSVGGYLFSYWNFTLTRNLDDGTLRIRRGLLTTNATSLDENRIRGVHTHEPVLMRPLRGARLYAIATGHDKHPLLLPPAPAAEVVRVGRLVAHPTDFGVGDELTMPLRRHGPGALSRRITRGLWAGVVVAAVAAVLVAGPLTWPWLVLGILIAAISTMLGVVRYHHLGVGLTDRSVVISPPRIARHRYVVDRAGTVGWASRASFFQRRRGVETLSLATAAGSESYAMVDLEPAASTGVMSAVSPDLVAPFLERTPD
ncbi:PH domain-containing protein [Gordonia sp. LSe1-13]|uniref:PH domain-containing protein n=1 Tax=Gordonia sesuvii TaxID=3116777 RepID=A0ABU7ME40_9ACTN|nr:PH domain-containing protein [Gordonia sp. LSe1-13]